MVKFHHSQLMSLISSCIKENLRPEPFWKMYSYQFPTRMGFAQELNQHINEYLFEPALPILTVDKKERYPQNKVLELDVYGIRRRLEED